MEWFWALSSAIRWGILALLITAILLLFEGSGMLSELTKGHRTTRKVMKIAFWILLTITIFLVIFWMVNPNIDTTAQQLSEMQKTLNEIKDILKSMQDAQGSIK
jgi:hypothetical protein